MSPDVIIGAVMAVTPISLAIQHALHRRQDEQSAEVWSTLAESTLTDLRAAERRAIVAEATVSALADDLAIERRCHVITRTALLDAERELAPLRQVLTDAEAVVTAFADEIRQQVDEMGQGA